MPRHLDEPENGESLQNKAALTPGMAKPPAPPPGLHIPGCWVEDWGSQAPCFDLVWVAEPPISALGVPPRELRWAVGLDGGPTASHTLNYSLHCRALMNY